MNGADSLTVLHAPGRRLAKRIRQSGVVEAYEGAKHFTLTEHPLSGLDELADALAWLLPRPAYAVVRGAVADSARVVGVRRLVHPCPDTGEQPTLQEAPRRWLALDVDSLPLPPGGDVRDVAGCGAYARLCLPSAFHNARCIVTASGSHGIKPGMRLRLWCWLDRPLTGPECRRWLRDYPVDPALFSPAQLVYCAAPVFDGGAPDPLPCRLAMLPGAREGVAPPSAGALVPPRPCPLPDTDRADAGPFALAALAGAASRVRHAPERTRHPTLLTEALRLVRLVDAGLLAAADVRRVLKDAAERCGLPDSEAGAVIDWALLHPTAGALPAGGGLMDAYNLPTTPEPEPELMDGAAPAIPDAPPLPAPDFAAAVSRLAALPVHDYELRRRAEARALGVRPAVLDREVKHARAAAAALDAPPPAPPGAADLALAVLDLAGLDAAAYTLALRREAKRLDVTPKDLAGFVTGERRRAKAEAAAADGAPPAQATAPADPRGRADLYVDRADLPDTAEALAALLAQRPMLFDRGVPVRLALDSQRGGLVASPLDLAGVVNECHAVARPWTYTRARDGGLVRQDVTLSDRVARLYLDRRGAWQLSPLDGIASAPLLAADGGTRAAEGYDPHTRLWCERIPDVDMPERPTKAEARAALDRLRLRLRTFAFADAPRVVLPGCHVPVVDVAQPPGLDEGAALAALLTAVCRPSLHLAPGLAVVAPSYSGAGSGKGLLVRAVCMVAFGAAPVTITAGADAEELEKRIASALMEAAPAVMLDNLNATALRSATLESALTERPSYARVMGGNRIVALNATAFLAVTGNGLTLSSDTARRFLTVELDAGLEEPETRAFAGDLLPEVMQGRATLLRDALTIWRWGRQAGDALPPGMPLGSFGQWCRWCRDPLLALGCPDPVQRIADAKLNDPRRRAVAELFHAWHKAHGSAAFTVADLAPAVQDAANPDGKPRQWLATRIRNLAGTRLAGYVLVHDAPDGKWSADRYSLQRADAVPPPGGIGGHGEHRGADSNTPPMPPMPPYGPETASDDAHEALAWSADA